MTPKKRTSKRTSKPSKRPDKNFPLLEFVFRKAPEDMAPFGLTAKSLTSVETIGEGANGVAFGLPDGKRILKVTNDVDEALIAKRILEQGGAVRGLPRVFYTARLPGDKAWRKNRAYAIVMELADTTKSRFRAFDEQLAGQRAVDPRDVFIQDFGAAVRFIMQDDGLTDEGAVDLAFDDSLDINSENLGIVRRDGRDMLVVIDLGQHPESLAYTHVPIAKNPSERPRGFPWPKATTVYHATTAMPAILRDGFKTRREIGGANALGGGTDIAVSFTLDQRTAVAIALGLRTIRGITRGEIGLGDMIVQAEQVAPGLLPQVKKNLELELHAMTPEDVVRIDRGLLWFRSGVFELDARSRQVLDLVDNGTIEVTFQDKYTLEGWIPADIRAQLRNDKDREVHERLHPGTPFENGPLRDWERFGRYRSQIVEVYKTLLHFGGWDGDSGRKFYNPLFFSTDLAPISRLSDEDIGVVSARLGADWLCSDPRSAEAMGFATPPIPPATLHQWSEGCQVELDRRRYGEEERPPKTRAEYHSTLPRDWDPPDPSDTVALLSSMAEIRVWNIKLIKSISEDLDLDGVMNAARDAWDRKGLEVDEPLWMPFHKDRVPFRG